MIRKLGPPSKNTRGRRTKHTPHHKRHHGTHHPLHRRNQLRQRRSNTQRQDGHASRKLGQDHKRGEIRINPQQGRRN